MTSTLGTLLIGSVFLLTGFIKATHSGLLAQQLYEVFPHQRFVRQLAVLFIAIEGFLGAALILRLQPQWLIPITIFLLIFLSAWTLYGWWNHSVEDCGCYGGLLQVTPLQSIVLNGFYIAILGIAWVTLVAPETTSWWQWCVPVLVAVSGFMMGNLSSRRAIMDLSFTRPGRRWKAQWTSHFEGDLTTGDVLVVFLGEECPYCKRWIPALNLINAQQDPPQVIGIMSISEEQVGAFCQQHGVIFPIVSIGTTLYRFMATEVPLAVLLKDGIIQQKWYGALPEDCVKRIYTFYDSIPRLQQTPPAPKVFSG